MKQLNYKTGIAFYVILSLAIVLISKYTAPLTADFYDEDHYDVVFFGTSESFTTFDPHDFYTYGMSAYNRGRMTQPIYMTYYYMLDAIDACDINTIVYEPHAMYDDTPPGGELKQEVIDSTLNNMRFSKYKVQMIWNCIEKSERWKYLFYLDKYHGRWQTIADYNDEQRGYWLRNEGEGENYGFQPWITYATSDQAYPSWEERNTPVDYEMSEVSQEYIEKIYQLCQDNNIRLIIAKSVYPCNETDIGLTQWMEKWCAEKDVPFVNYMNLYEEIGIVEEEDNADGGYHLNGNGAAKVTNHFLQYIGSHKYYKKLGEEDSE